jgi:hypothetical protein
MTMTQYMKEHGRMDHWWVAEHTEEKGGRRESM